MAKGLLKLWMLRIISEGKVNGYQIIKRVGEITGKRPSTGSVYPHLNSMKEEGWIIGKEIDNKTFYEITNSGKELVEKHKTMKEHYSQRIHESIALAHDTFEDLDISGVNNFYLLNPLADDISKLLADGIEPKKIKEIIIRARDELHKLK